mgnify:CR=1 FL=1
MMKQYDVKGMTCAACQARVEKAVSKVTGVTSCSVSLLTNSMRVEGTALPSKIISAVEKAGYHAKLKDELNHTVKNQIDEPLKDTETPKLLKRLISSVIILLILMYVSMGHMMFNWPIPPFFSSNHMALGLLQLLLSGIVLIINYRFFVNGMKALIHFSPNMDTLIAMGSGVSYIYSIYALFMMSDGIVKGNADIVMKYMDNLYFETAAMILTLITIGKTLESYSKGKTTNALKSLMKLAPKTATLLIHEEERVVQIEEVKKGDIFVVKPGENIPVDGIVLEGISAINESALTGESIPVDKSSGDMVSAATLNQSGYLKCEATRVGEDTTLAQIIKMVTEASTTKAPIAKIADTISGIFVPTVIVIALITFVTWLIISHNFVTSFEFAVSVLVVSCPCALGLATPVAIMVGSGKGAKNGILFKTAESIEETGKVKIVALDKTGTITKGEPVVTDIFPLNDITKEQLLTLAYSLEIKSEHPLAKAIVKKAQEENIKENKVNDFKILPGNGLVAKLGNDTIYGGSLTYISSITTIYPEVDNIYNELSKKGKTPLLFVKEDSIIGMIGVSDIIKEDSVSAIKELQNLGMYVVMLTGDNATTAGAIGNVVGVNEVIAGVLPNEKEKVIRDLQRKGKVAMVGDGINDAPALTRADIGIAIGAGTDVAIDAADVVLMNSKLSDVVGAIKLSKHTLVNIKENLFWAFIYNIIGIPLAAGVFFASFGLKLVPMFGALAMSLSSVCVVTNALRLNLINIYKPVRLKLKSKITIQRKEDEKMKKELIVEGMMCAHCEARVKKALEEVDGVVKAQANHKTKKVVVKLEKEVTDDVLVKAITDQDYEVKSIQ